MNSYKIEIGTDTKGIIELSVALAHAISTLQEKNSDDEKCVFSNSIGTLRNLLTFIHGTVDPEDNNARCQRVRYFGDKQYRFF